MTRLAGLWKKQVFFAVVGSRRVCRGQPGELPPAGGGQPLALRGRSCPAGVSRRQPVPSASAVRPPDNGAHCWIVGIGSLAIQPSELCKLAYMLALAWYLRYRSNYRSFRALIGPFVLTLGADGPDSGRARPGDGDADDAGALHHAVHGRGAGSSTWCSSCCWRSSSAPFCGSRCSPTSGHGSAACCCRAVGSGRRPSRVPTFSKILVGGKFTERRWQSDWGYHLIRSKYAIASGGAGRPGIRPRALHQVQLPAVPAQRLRLLGHRPPGGLSGLSRVPGTLRRAGLVRVGDRGPQHRSLRPAGGGRDLGDVSSSRCSSTWA